MSDAGELWLETFLRGPRVAARDWRDRDRIYLRHVGDRPRRFGELTLDEQARVVGREAIRGEPARKLGAGLQ